MSGFEVAVTECVRATVGASDFSCMQAHRVSAQRASAHAQHAGVKTTILQSAQKLARLIVCQRIGLFLPGASTRKLCLLQLARAVIMLCARCTLDCRFAAQSLSATANPRCAQRLNCACSSASQLRLGLVFCGMALLIRSQMPFAFAPSDGP
eukprot:910950-Pleurochrysis_carterae.AAC.14